MVGSFRDGDRRKSPPVKKTSPIPRGSGVMNPRGFPGAPVSGELRIDESLQRPGAETPAIQMR